MSAQGVMSRQIVVVLVLLGLGAAIGVGVGDPFNWRQAAQPVSEPEATDTAAVSEPALGEPENTEPEVAEAPKVETAQEPALPRLQEVRVEADGLAVIAGQATPGTQLILRADGQEVARATADPSGAFATVALLGSSADARVLSLVEVGADGAERQSPDEIIIAPVAASTPVADAGTTDTAQAEDIAENTSEDTGEDMAQAADTGEAAVAPREDVTGQDDTTVQAPKSEADGTPQEAAESATVTASTASNVTLSTSGTELNAATRVQTSEAMLPETEDAVDTSEDVVTAALEPASQDTVEIPAKNQEPAPKPELVAKTPAPKAASDQPAPQAPEAAEEEPRPEPQVADTELSAPKEEDTQQVALLKSNEEGVQVIQPVVPSAQEMRQIALDSISYSDAGEVELAGRAQSNTQQVRVYLDNQPIAQLPVDTSGSWRGELPDVDTGVYTLRIDEIADDGAVTSRVETPFKREEPQVLAAASAQTSDRPVKAITVQQGATLWAIARDRYGEGIQYVQVFEANKALIRDPNLIYPGQVFTLPEN